MNKKAQLRKQADELWRRVCIKQYGQNSLISNEPARDIHHFFPKGNFGHLRYNTDNGCPLTRGEHFAHHHIGNPTIHQRIIDKRGRKWYNELEKLAMEKQKPSYANEKWYKENIERLKALIEA